MIKKFFLISTIKASINNQLILNQQKQELIIKNKLKKYNNIYFFTLMLSCFVSLIINNFFSIEPPITMNLINFSIIITCIFWKFILKKNFINLSKKKNTIEEIFTVDNNILIQQFRIIFEILIGLLIEKFFFKNNKKGKQIDKNILIRYMVFAPIFVECFLLMFSVFMEEKNKNKPNNYVADDATLIY